MSAGAAAELVVNGRFLTRPLAGVDRMAGELLAALQARLDRGEPTPFAALRLVVPARAEPVSPPPDGVAVTRAGRLAGTLWEQVELPRVARNGWLFSPCNVGPLACAQQIVTIHDAQVYLAATAYSRAFRTWYRWLLPRLARRARLVTTVSDYSRRTLEDCGVLPAGKAVVIHNGADHILRVRPDAGVLARHGLQPGRYFLAIGSLSPHKNLATAVAAAGLRRDRTLPLVIAGGGSARVFADAGLTAAEDVRFLGRVSDPELRALLDHATALVFPSLFEGFGLPPLEAMMCGCPVIAADIPTLAEVCGAAAVRLDPRQPALWAAEMEALAADPGLRDRRADAGRAHASRFTWDRAAAAFVEAMRHATEATA